MMKGEDEDLVWKEKRIVKLSRARLFFFGDFLFFY